jgi:hypothetical protein
VIEIAVGPSLIVRVAPHGEPSPPGVASVAVAIADPERRRALTAAIADALTGALHEAAPAVEAARRAPIVRLRSRKRLARVSIRLGGAIAIVRVTARNAHHLVELVDGIRAAGASGVQLVWDGVAPPRADVERHVFAVLERARATPSQPPVVLATSDRPACALHVLVAQRSPSTPKDDAP